ncbi:hypothetical protein [Breoghania sp. JC706]|uniref:hypothetical protein n=1 Tax=Breoghania sp. JC706 TaxID=3117732 RepID=UPI003008AE8A
MADKRKREKTFAVPEGDTGTDLKRYGSLYGRDRTVNRDAGIATNDRSLFGGWWSKEEDYTWRGKGRDGGVHDGGLDGDIYARTRKKEKNPLRTREVEYHPDGSHKSVKRQYPLGFHATDTYDEGGEQLSRERGDFIGSTKWSKTPDGKRQTFEQTDLFGWYGKTQQALGRPDGGAQHWRTTHRRLGRYEMNVVPDANGKGETKVRSWGKRKAGAEDEIVPPKNGRGQGRAKGRPLFERSVHYDFENMTKQVTRKFLWFERTRPPKALSPKERQKIELRQGQKRQSEATWQRHATGGARGSGKDAGREAAPISLEAALKSREAPSAAERDSRLDDWLKATPPNAAAAAEHGSPERAGARRSPTMETPPPAYSPSNVPGYSPAGAREDVFAKDVSPDDSASQVGTRSQASLEKPPAGSIAPDEKAPAPEAQRERHSGETRASTPDTGLTDAEKIAFSQASLGSTVSTTPTSLHPSDAASARETPPPPAAAKSGVASARDAPQVNTNTAPQARSEVSSLGGDLAGPLPPAGTVTRLGARGRPAAMPKAPPTVADSSVVGGPPAGAKAPKAPRQMETMAKAAAARANAPSEVASALESSLGNDLAGPVPRAGGVSRTAGRVRPAAVPKAPPSVADSSAVGVPPRGRVLSPERSFTRNDRGAASVGLGG